MGLADHREDVVLIQDLVLDAVDFDFGAAVLVGQHDVADADFKRDFVAVVVRSAGAQCDDFAFLRFFFRGIWNDDSALLHFSFLGGFHENAVTKGLDFEFSHCVFVVS